MVKNEDRKDIRGCHTTEAEHSRAAAHAIENYRALAQFKTRLPSMRTLLDRAIAKKDKAAR